ncbi:TIGR02453 family protein [Cycloclasticus sp. 46_120_T64]|nr:TIGR02453 family protein [Cycloclasticus sp. 46_120_T64]
MPEPIFNQQSFDFLQQLAKNNNRAWFNEHKTQYEETIRGPALTLIEAMQSNIQALSPHFNAVAKKTGGSLMRVYRDTRFSKDKTPYKINIGIQFKHRCAKDVHAPAFYLHIANEECFLGAGIWRPSGPALANIRQMISDNPRSWENITTAVEFQRYFSLSGDRLKTYPRGYDKNHPMINDLRRKDFIAIHPLSTEQILSESLIQTINQAYESSADFMDYLCNALELNY